MIELFVVFMFFYIILYLVYRAIIILFFLIKKIFVLIKKTKAIDNEINDFEAQLKKLCNKNGIDF